MMKNAGLITLTLMLVFHGAPALSEDAERGYQMGLSLETYPDRWNFLPRHQDPLVTVPSSRMTLNAHLDNFFRAGEGLLLGLDGRVHWRDRAEGMDRRAMSGADYDYHGMDLKALSGYRFGAPGDAIRYDMRMGVGYRAVSGESRVPGAVSDDDLGVFYTQFSGGPRFSSGNWRGFLEMGVRVPLSLDDRVYGPAPLDGMEVGDGRRSAGFVSFQNLFQLSDSSALRLDLYYDSQRYGLYDGAGRYTLMDDLQDRRDRDVFGFEMGLSF